MAGAGNQLNKMDSIIKHYTELYGDAILYDDDAEYEAGDTKPKKKPLWKPKPSDPSLGKANVEIVNYNDTGGGGKAGLSSVPYAYNKAFPFVKTEQEHAGPPPGSDPRECTFYTKTGACKFGVKCSRQHVTVSEGFTILITNMFQDSRLSIPHLNDRIPDVVAPEELEINEVFEQFYNDVINEFRAVGKVVMFKVSQNFVTHLRGNVYVQYETMQEAMNAFAFYNNKKYNGNTLQVHITHVVDWMSGLCSLYDRRICPRGKMCNFLHVFRNPQAAFTVPGRTDWDPDRARRNLEYKKMMGMVPPGMSLYPGGVPGAPYTGPAGAFPHGIPGMPGAMGAMGTMGAMDPMMKEMLEMEDNGAADTAADTFHVLTSRDEAKKGEEIKTDHSPLKKVKDEPTSPKEANGASNMMTREEFEAEKMQAEKDTKEEFHMQKIIQTKMEADQAKLEIYRQRMAKEMEMAVRSPAEIEAEREFRRLERERRHKERAEQEKREAEAAKNPKPSDKKEKDKIVIKKEDKKDDKKESRHDKKDDKKKDDRHDKKNDRKGRKDDRKDEKKDSSSRHRSKSGDRRGKDRKERSDSEETIKKVNRLISDLKNIKEERMKTAAELGERATQDSASPPAAKKSKRDDEKEEKGDERKSKRKSEDKSEEESDEKSKNKSKHKKAKKNEDSGSDWGDSDGDEDGSDDDEAQKRREKRKEKRKEKLKKKRESKSNDDSKDASKENSQTSSKESSSQQVPGGSECYDPAYGGKDYAAWDDSVVMANQMFQAQADQMDNRGQERSGRQLSKGASLPSDSGLSLEFLTNYAFELTRGLHEEINQLKEENNDLKRQLEEQRVLLQNSSESPSTRYPR